MVIPESPIVHLYIAYDKYEAMIKETKWYQFIRRSRLKKELFKARIQGANLGFQLALKDLADCGIIKFK